MKKEISHTEPDQSWLSGNYPNINAEVNTKLPFVAIGDYFWQGEEADQVIEEIYLIWINSNITTEEAIEKYALSLP
jgi:hypothetical protein